MSENKLESLIKISDLKAKKNIEINRLAYKIEYLVPCQVDIREEEVEFIYNLEELEYFNEIKNRKIVEKLRAAINIANSFEILDQYSFSIEPSNLYYDYNYNIKVLERDIRLEEEIIDYEDLTLQYKSLLGYLFNEKYSYEDFYNGGIDLIKSNKMIKKYLTLNNISEIRSQLLLDLKDQEKKQREEYVEIKLRNIKIRKYSMITMGVAIIGLAAYVVYNSIFLNPFYKNIIKADSYYMAQDYEGVIKSLDKTRGLKLDKDTKYKLAHSYIISENLSDPQKKNIIANLHAKSDENILDYWIAIGKSNYDSAIDLAKRVQDDEMLLFALLNKDKYIQENTKITGEEKQKQQDAIKSEIDKLTKELNETNTLQKNSLNGKNDNASGNTTNATNTANTANAGDVANKNQNSGSGSSGLNLAPNAN